MSFVKRVAALAALAVLCASNPVEHLPTLGEVPAEALFVVSEPPQPLTLPCATTARSQNVQYNWQKDGKPYECNSHADVVKRDNEGTLVFLKPKDSDEGRYQCFAVSEAGVASTRIVNVRKAYIKIPNVTAQKHEPVEGQTFKLECPIPDSYPKPTIQWRLEFESDPSVSNEVANARYTVSPDGTLYFSSIEKSDVFDNFKYVCQATSPATSKPVVLAEHYIQSLKPNNGKDFSEVVEQYASQDMTVKVGDVTTLFCIFGGIPLAHPDWFKDGKDVNNSPKDRVTRYNKSKGKRLLIRDTWLEDQGTYLCTVDNEKGKPKQHSMYLTVVSAPVFEQKPPSQMAGKVGQSAKISCPVLAVPSAAVHWTYNATPLTKREGLTISNTNEGNRTLSEIHFTNLKSSDSGYYGCNAINDNGDIYAETLLHVA